LSPLREELKAAIDADAESYNSVMKAYKLGKTGERKKAMALIEAALKEATRVPLNVAEKGRVWRGLRRVWRGSRIRNYE